MGLLLNKPTKFLHRKWKNNNSNEYEASTKGQVVIPGTIRKTLKWKIDLKLEIIDADNAVMLGPQDSFPKTSLREVAGCLKHSGKAKTSADMEEAIRRGAHCHKISYS